MKRHQQQASVLALRIITDDYYAPLGVWVVREAVRKAMESEPIVFDGNKRLLHYAKTVAQKKFGVDISEHLAHSVLLQEVGVQKRLGQYS
jgi:hypothetical protein